MDPKKLIESVKKYAALYIPELKQFSDKRLRDCIWAKIGEHLEQDASACAKKLGYLRRNYIRNLTKPKGSRNYRIVSDLRFLKKTLPTKTVKRKVGTKLTVIKQNTPPDSGNSSMRKSPKSDPVAGSSNFHNLSKGFPTIDNASMNESADNRKGSLILDCSAFSDNDNNSDSDMSTLNEDNNVTLQIDKMKEDSDNKSNDWEDGFFGKFIETLNKLSPLMQADVKLKQFSKSRVIAYLHFS